MVDLNINAPFKLQLSALDAIDQVFSRSNLRKENVASDYAFTGDVDSVLIFAMVVLYNGKYYCFNYHPKRKNVALTHTLTKCQDMRKQVQETLNSLRRLYGE